MGKISIFFDCLAHSSSPGGVYMASLLESNYYVSTPYAQNGFLQLYFHLVYAGRNKTLCVINHIL